MGSLHIVQHGPVLWGVDDDCLGNPADLFIFSFIRKSISSGLIVPISSFSTVIAPSFSGFSTLLRALRIPIGRLLPSLVLQVSVSLRWRDLGAYAKQAPLPVKA